MPVGVELTLQLIVAPVERVRTAIATEFEGSERPQHHHFIEDPTTERRRSLADDARVLCGWRWGSATCMTRCRTRRTTQGQCAAPRALQPHRFAKAYPQNSNRRCP